MVETQKQASQFREPQEMQQPFTPPGFESRAFHCPHCNAYANQLWFDVHIVVARHYHVFRFHSQHLAGFDRRTEK
jgi:hypothetical protein